MDMMDPKVHAAPSERRSTDEGDGSPSGRTLNNAERSAEGDSRPVMVTTQAAKQPPLGAVPEGVASTPAAPPRSISEMVTSVWRGKVWAGFIILTALLSLVLDVVAHSARKAAGNDTFGIVVACALAAVWIFDSGVGIYVGRRNRGGTARERTKMFFAPGSSLALGIETIPALLLLAFAAVAIANIGVSHADPGSDAHLCRSRGIGGLICDGEAVFEKDLGPQLLSSVRWFHAMSLAVLVLPSMKIPSVLARVWVRGMDEAGNYKGMRKALLTRMYQASLLLLLWAVSLMQIVAQLYLARPQDRHVQYAIQAAQTCLNVRQTFNIDSATCARIATDIVRAAQLSSSLDIISPIEVVAITANGATVVVDQDALPEAALRGTLGAVRVSDDVITAHLDANTFFGGTELFNMALKLVVLGMCLAIVMASTWLFHTQLLRPVVRLVDGVAAAASYIDDDGYVVSQATREDDDLTSVVKRVLVLVDGLVEVAKNSDRADANVKSILSTARRAGRERDFVQWARTYGGVAERFVGDGEARTSFLGKAVTPANSNGVRLSHGRAPTHTILPGSAAGVVRAPMALPPVQEFEALGTFDFDVLSLPTDRLAGALASLFRLASIPPSAVPDDKLQVFCDLIVANYLDNPYHSAWHAIDVCNSVVTLLTSSRSLSTLGLEHRLVLLVAAAGHDLAHRGVSNKFLVDSRDSLALIYNEQAVQEQMHASMLFTLLLEHPEADVLANMSSSSVKNIRRMVIQVILHTDMAQHFEVIAKLDKLLQQHPDGLEKHGGTFDELTGLGSDRIQDLLNAIMHFADVGSTLKPWPLAHAWGRRVLQEFFMQGDAERELGRTPLPMMDRDSAIAEDVQLGFIEIFIQPFSEKVANLFPDLAWVCVNAATNVLRWSELLAEVHNERGDVVAANQAVQRGREGSAHLTDVARRLNPSQGHWSDEGTTIGKGQRRCTEMGGALRGDTVDSGSSGSKRQSESMIGGPPSALLPVGARARNSTWLNKASSAIGLSPGNAVPALDRNGTCPR
ncbi:unnamed protein product [Pedinophyceae sp. YPF-701]|nr:unnamed protein product [Pedinophyceae sp. YPF-701]